MVQRVRQAPGATRRNPTTVRALSYAHAFVPKLWPDLPMSRPAAQTVRLRRECPWMPPADLRTDGRRPAPICSLARTGVPGALQRPAPCRLSNSC